MIDQSIVVESSLSEPPNVDEQPVIAGEQPTGEEQVAPLAPEDGVPEDSGDTTADNTDYKKRHKDTQTALNKKNEEVANMKGQLAVLMANAQGQNATPQKSQAEMQAEHEAFVEKVREDPAAILDHVYDIMKSRDAYWEDQMSGMNGNVARMSPEYIENKETIDGLRKVPAFASMSDAGLLGVAKQVATVVPRSKPVMQPQGSMSGNRSASHTTKPVSLKDKYHELMVQSGAIKSTAKPGMITLEEG